MAKLCELLSSPKPTRIVRKGIHHADLLSTIPPCNRPAVQFDRHPKSGFRDGQLVWKMEFLVTRSINIY